jgi:hypothetical protein
MSLWTTGYAAPYHNEHDSGDNGTDYWHTFQAWLTDDMKVEEADDEENGKQANHDRAQNTGRCAPARKELAQKARDGCDDNPYDKLSECYFHGKILLIKTNYDEHGPSASDTCIEERGTQRRKM